jgi:hypothetical protein
LVVNPEAKRPLRKPRYGWEGEYYNGSYEIVWEGGIDLSGSVKGPVEGCSENASTEAWEFL